MLETAAGEGRVDLEAAGRSCRPAPLRRPARSAPWRCSTGPGVQAACWKSSATLRTDKGRSRSPATAVAGQSQPSNPATTMPLNMRCFSMFHAGFRPPIPLQCMPREPREQRPPGKTRVAGGKQDGGRRKGRAGWAMVSRGPCEAANGPRYRRIVAGESGREAVEAVGRSRSGQSRRPISTRPSGCGESCGSQLTTATSS